MRPKKWFSSALDRWGLSAIMPTTAGSLANGVMVYPYNEGMSLPDSTTVGLFSFYSAVFSHMFCHALSDSEIYDERGRRVFPDPSYDHFISGSITTAAIIGSGIVLYSTESALLASLTAVVGYLGSMGAIAGISSTHNARTYRKLTAEFEHLQQLAQNPDVVDKYFAGHPEAFIRFLKDWMPQKLAAMRAPAEAEITTLRANLARLQSEEETLAALPLDLVANRSAQRATKLAIEKLDVTMRPIATALEHIPALVARLNVLIERRNRIAATEAARQFAAQATGETVAAAELADNLQAEFADFVGEVRTTFEGVLINLSVDTEIAVNALAAPAVEDASAITPAMQQLRRQAGGVSATTPAQAQISERK